jgi:cytochrome P450
MSTKTVSDYSMLDHETQSDPYEFYALLHEECPVYHMPETGFYMVTKYDDMRRVLKDTDIFTSDVRRTVGLQGDGKTNIYQDILADRGWSHVQTLQRTDPPEHTRYRKLLDRVFTARRVREMVPYIESVTNELIDGWIDDGEVDFISGFAMPQPGIIIAEQLGLERSQVGTFKKWADAMLATAIKPLTEEELLDVVETELEAQHFFAKTFEDRRVNPGDDLMSGFVHAHGDDEEPLTMHELQNLMHQLITGGFETTQSALAHSMWVLLRQPELQTRLRDDPSLIKAFVEEALRYESPVQGLSRMTTQDVNLGGITIPANSMVVVRYGAANRDPEKFECPHQFDLDRKNAGAHIAFGMGAHFCVGAMLARQEMISAVTHVLRRMDNIRLAKEMAYPVHDTSLFFLPIKEMYIAFDKIN